MSGEVDGVEIISVIDEQFVEVVMNVLKKNSLTVERIFMLQLKKSMRMIPKIANERREIVGKMKSKKERSADSEKIG